jgi:hypothetical protein
MTAHFELCYSGPLINIAGWTDSDWAGDIGTRRTTSGYVFNDRGRATSWSSERPPTVALSFAEAAQEYAGKTQAAEEAM